MGNAAINGLLFPVPPKEVGESSIRDHGNIELKTASGEIIPVVSIGDTNYYTILYSHGNAEDLGLILPYLYQLSQTCGVHVVSYDYVGYGIASGSPTEKGCYESIHAVYNYLKKVVPPERIILFGRSLGSGPTCYMASEAPCRAVILQSPLESGACVVFGNGLVSSMASSIDPFKNYLRAPKITCPVLIMHGEADEVVPCANGKRLFNAFPNADPEPLWLPGRGHNNMPEQQCHDRINIFIKQL